MCGNQQTGPAPADRHAHRPGGLLDPAFSRTAGRAYGRPCPGSWRSAAPMDAGTCAGAVCSHWPASDHAVPRVDIERIAHEDPPVVPLHAADVPRRGSARMIIPVLVQVSFLRFPAPGLRALPRNDSPDRQHVCTCQRRGANQFKGDRPPASLPFSVCRAFRPAWTGATGCYAAPALNAGRPRLAAHHATRPDDNRGKTAKTMPYKKGTSCRPCLAVMHGHPHPSWALIFFTLAQAGLAGSRSDNARGHGLQLPQYPPPITVDAHLPRHHTCSG